MCGRLSERRAHARPRQVGPANSVGRYFRLYDARKLKNGSMAPNVT
jgi:hypothetical protein